MHRANYRLVVSAKDRDKFTAALVAVRSFIVGLELWFNNFGQNDRSTFTSQLYKYGNIFSPPDRKLGPARDFHFETHRFERTGGHLNCLKGFDFDPSSLVERTGSPSSSGPLYDLNEIRSVGFTRPQRPLKLRFVRFIESYYLSPSVQSGNQVVCFRIPNSDGFINSFLYGAICRATVEWFGVIGNRLRPSFAFTRENEFGSGCWHLWRMKYWHTFRWRLCLR